MRRLVPVVFTGVLLIACGGGDRPARRRYFSSTKIAAPGAVRMSVSAATPSRLALSRAGPPGSFAGCHQLVLCHSSSGV